MGLSEAQISFGLSLFIVALGTVAPRDAACSHNVWSQDGGVCELLLAFLHL